MADGIHLRTDILSSSGVLASLLVQSITHWRWVDPVVAFFVAGVVFFIGGRTLYDAVLPLLDVKLPADEEQSLRHSLDTDPRVLGYHALRTRKSGSHRHVDVHVQAADNLSFVEAHRLSEELEERLRGSFQYARHHSYRTVRGQGRPSARGTRQRYAQREAVLTKTLHATWMVRVADVEDASIRVAGVVLLYLVLRLLINFLATRLANITLARQERTHNARLLTFVGLFRSVGQYALFFIFVVALLHALGIDLVSLVTTVSVVGLTVGFGAQKLIKDVDQRLLPDA